MNLPLKILLVEDNPSDADLIQEVLSPNGSNDIKIIWVSRLSEALSRLRANETDLALLDLGLPDSDGIDSVCSVVKAAPHLPIVVLTGCDDETTGIAAVHEGAQDYLFKGEISPNLLLRAIKYAIERKKIEQALKASERRFKEIFDHTDNGVAVYRAINDGSDFILVDINQSVERIENIQRGEVIGQKATDVFPGLKACGLLEVFQRVWSTGNPEHPPKFYYQDQRIWGWRDSYVYRLPSAEIVAIYSDETQRIQAQQELKESEQRYRTAIEHSNVGVAMLKGLRHAYVNQKYLEIFGYREPEALLGQPMSKILHPDDIQKISDLIERREKSEPAPSRYECKGLKKDGQTVYIEASVAQTTFQGDTVTLAYLRDISQRRKAEEDRIRLATAIEQASEIVVITDRKGDILYVNPALEIISGYKKAELIGQNPRILKSGKHDRAFYRSLWDTLISGKVWKGRFVNRKKDGSFYEEDATITPIKDARGDITNYVAVKRDVTEEIRKERQLRQAQKMEAIGTLAGGIAHDFNNILSAIIGYAELTLEKVQNNESLTNYLNEIFNAGVRAKDLVKQILAFSRQSEEELRPVQVDLIIKEVLKLLRASLPTTIAIHQNISSNKSVLADPTQIHQILMNLCTNAGHSMRDKGGLLEVSLVVEELDTGFAARYPDITPGPYLKLSICDTGHGISPENLDKIFDPFFTTKKRGEGTGMGLAVVHGIVRSLGGAITVYSELEKGTTFTVYLPVIGLDSKLEIKTTEPLSFGTERILFVDDEKALADLGRKMLEQHGYVVTTRTSSTEALELFKSQPDEFDMVITDLTMPNMTGKFLAQEIMKIRPDIPVIICTGFSEEVTGKTAKAAGIKAFIHKPMTSAVLLTTVQKVLNHHL
jgi:two-component system cell cycle sensor histidine kinase/response regulator CckA